MLKRNLRDSPLGSERKLREPLQNLTEFEETFKGGSHQRVERIEENVKDSPLES